MCLFYRNILEALHVFSRDSSLLDLTFLLLKFRNTSLKGMNLNLAYQVSNEKEKKSSMK